MLIYPAKFASEGRKVVVTFRDIPEANTAASPSKAEAMGIDALMTAMEFYVERNDLIPMPSPPRADEHLLALPASFTAKVLLLNQMRTQGVTASELARRLKTDRQSVNRIVNLRHVTKIDTIAQALHVLGGRIHMSVEDL